MDQTVINWIIAAAASVGGFFFKILWDAVVNLRDDIRVLDAKMHEDFVRRDDFREAIADIKTDMRNGFSTINTAIMSISDKLDNKEDKE